MNPERAAILVQIAFLDIQVSNLSAPQSLEACRGGLKICAVRETCHRFALELFGIEAEHGAEGPIAVAIATLTVRESDPDRRVLDGIAKERFYVPGGLSQQGFHLVPRNASV